jgi:hypothetical protein
LALVLRELPGGVTDWLSRSFGTGFGSGSGS